ncbi:MAG: hypothetical protein GC188_10145 [Alphaproteobacteria bacterium]|nr:hypothetical protein [Alphaproteobacteria bacterium]
MIIAAFSALVLQSMPYAEGCTEGVWEALSQTRNAQGEMSGNHDRSNRYCFHDGRAELAEYRSLGPDNQPVFFGVSLTVWNADRTEGRTLWAMVGDAGYTEIVQHWDGDVLVTTGEGFDTGGRFLERARYEFAPGGDYRFEMDRSFDGGESWESPTNIIEALKTAHPPEPLNATWSPNLAASAASVMPEGGQVILDGLAWFDWVLADSGQPAGARFAAPVEADGQWVWQILTWTADGIEVRHQAMN